MRHLRVRIHTSKIYFVLYVYTTFESLDQENDIISDTSDDILLDDNIANGEKDVKDNYKYQKAY